MANTQKLTETTQGNQFARDDQKTGAAFGPVTLGTATKLTRGGYYNDYDSDGVRKTKH